MKIRILLLLPLLAAAWPAQGQSSPHLAGAVEVDLLHGRITADLCLSGAAPRGDTLRFALHRGMNVERVRHPGGRTLPFSTRVDGEALDYAVRDTVRGGADGVCVEYTGAYPVYDVRAEDYRDGDGSAVIAFSGTTLRARGSRAGIPPRWTPPAARRATTSPTASASAARRARGCT